MMSVQEEQPGPETTSEEDSLKPWQTYFSKQFKIFFQRGSQSRNCFKLRKRTESADYIAIKG